MVETHKKNEKLSLRLVGAISASLRVLLLGSKFIFMLALARTTSPATIGVYTLTVTVVTILIYVIGAEVHTYTTREIIGSGCRNEKAQHIQNHICFVLTGFLLCLPVAWVTLIWLKIFEQLTFTLFALVLLGEVLCQEFGRYLIAMSQPVSSNVLQLLRGAAWMPFAVWLLYSSDWDAVDVVLAMWSIGCIIAIIFGIYRLRSCFCKRFSFSMSWLKHAVNNSSRYFIVVLLVQVQTFADRFIIQYNMGEHSVGLFAFYQSFANTIQGFVLTGVISILMPRLLAAVKNNSLQEVRNISQRMLKASLGVAAFVSAALLLGMPSLLKLVGRESYGVIFNLFPWLLLGNILTIAGQIPHLQLYAQRSDALLMRISMILVPLGVVLNLIAIQTFGLAGVVAVFVIVAALQAIVKTYYARRLFVQQALKPQTVFE